MKRKFFWSVATIVAILLTSCSSYSSIMRKSVKKALGKDFKGYYAFSYPTNNFGLITSFENKLANENQYCAMVECLDGINISNRNEWLNIQGLADIGQGGPIKLSENKKTKISIDAVLPKLWSVLSLDGSFSNEREVKTTLDIGPAYVRFLNKKKFDEYINKLPDNNKYKQKYDQGILIIITSDVVVEYLTVKIGVDNQLSTRLDAVIDAGQLDAKFKNFNLDAKFAKTSSGIYELTIDKPVIVLRLAKKRPSSKEFFPIDTFDKWDPVQDFINNQSSK